MSTQERNLSQEFEALLNGRSILDLVGEEAALASELLTEIVKSKPLKSLTKVELQALVEELSEIIAINMFHGDPPHDWEQQVLDKIKSAKYERDLELSFASILDLYLHNVEMWKVLDAEDSEVVAKAILKYLEGKEYYDYVMNYVEDYIEDEEDFPTDDEIGEEQGLEIVKVNRKELLEVVKKAIEKTNELLDSKACLKEGLYGVTAAAISICSEKVSIEVKKACVEDIVEGREKRAKIYLFHVYSLSGSKFEERRYERVFSKLYLLEKLLEASSTDEVAIQYKFPSTVWKFDDQEISF